MDESMVQSGISRRDLLKRSAVAGGLVWAAPTILASPASATDQCGNCAHDAVFALKHNNQNNATGVNACEAPGANVSTGNCSATGGYITTRNGCCLIPSLITFSTGANNSTHIYTLKPGVRLCEAFAKCGNLCNTTSDETHQDDDGNTVVTITCSNLSHSEIVVCFEGTVLPAGCS